MHTTTGLSRRGALLALGALPGLAWAQAARPPVDMPADMPANVPANVPAEVAAELSGSRMLGMGRLTWFGLSVYDARLWAGERFNAAQFEREPLALELQYARKLHGKQIAERSLAEMQRFGAVAQADAARWLASMTQLFPDVHRGDRLTGVLRPGEAARFYFNGKLLGEVRETDFARRFFAIWLSPQTSEPKLRQALLGGPQAGS
jgi:Chalcone isomerase-like